jgi:hypothetical protein
MKWHHFDYSLTCPVCKYKHYYVKLENKVICTTGGYYSRSNGKIVGSKCSNIIDVGRGFDIEIFNVYIYSKYSNKELDEILGKQVSMKTVANGLIKKYDYYKTILEEILLGDL